MVFPTFFNLHLNFSASGLVDIIREYYKQYSPANKLVNLEEADKFLAIYSLSKLNQKETDNVNMPITNGKLNF